MTMGPRPYPAACRTMRLTMAVTDGHRAFGRATARLGRARAGRGHAAPEKSLG
jgi:hypothetical protein